ncbi:energy transducer TonB [Allomuricauda sp. NBRC 101325]|uniref:energy transducer TonB n=1 Tax=Allomuricauda sp. NBRC 101325 TaxID=1113758 RepID=UPI002554206D|nr:energy transducer TonB [Muricauda sp. NBRC 101325]
MRPKKNPQLDLRKNSLLYFMVGMTVILLLTFLALEWKTFDTNSDWDVGILKVDKDLIEEATILKLKIPEPPKPKIQTPPKIEIAEDDEKVEETFIESNDIDYDTPVAEVESIEVAEVDVPDEIPFMLIENAPIFPGCEGETTEEGKRNCFQEMMLKHIRKNFRYPEPAQELGLEGRVNVIFTVQKDGSIGNVMLRGPHESLEKEAARIISKLPKLTPGKQRGTPVKVPYSIPITFILN